MRGACLWAKVGGRIKVRCVRGESWLLEKEGKGF